MAASRILLPCDGGTLRIAVASAPTRILVVRRSGHGVGGIGDCPGQAAPRRSESMVGTRRGFVRDKSAVYGWTRKRRKPRPWPGDGRTCDLRLLDDQQHHSRSPLPCHAVSVSNGRLVSLEEGQVAFTAKDYAAGGKNAWSAVGCWRKCKRQSPQCGETPPSRFAGLLPKKARILVAVVNLKALVSKLNPLCIRALEGAAGLCLSRSNYNVEIEHWLLKLLEPDNTDLRRILRHYDI